MTQTEVAETHVKTKAETEFDDWMAKWEGSPESLEGDARQRHYLEIAGFMIAALNDQVAELRADICSIRDANSTRDKAFAAIDQAVFELQSPQSRVEATLEPFETKPTIRVRVQHSHTLKEGWRLSETTVEYSGEEIQWPAIDRELRFAHVIGTAESQRRNKASAEAGES